MAESKQLTPNERYFAEIREAGNAARRAAGLKEWRENELPWESQFQQLNLWEGLQSLQEALDEAAAARPKQRGPKQGSRRNEGAWGDLPKAPPLNDPDRPAYFTANDRRQMHAREEFARAIGREARRKQSAVERCNFFCNRLVESRFPTVQFSELDYFTYSAQYHGHPIEREDEDE